jgi:hypothetical protein
MAYIVMGPAGPSQPLPLGVSVEGDADNTVSDLNAARGGYAQLRMKGSDRKVYVSAPHVLWVEDRPSE